MVTLFLPSCGGQTYPQGAFLYNYHCASCHMEDGQGLVGNIPPLAGSDKIRKDPAYMSCVIRMGVQGPIEIDGVLYNQAMPGNKDLTEFEITNIINYINQAWGNDFGYTSVGEVREKLDACTPK